MNPVQSWGAVAVLATTVLMSCTETPAVNMNPWNPRLAETTAKLLKDTASVAEERKSELNALAQWTAETLNERGQADLIFICTHNSRRSHLSQVWAQVGADVAGVKGIRTLSRATGHRPRRDQPHLSGLHGGFRHGVLQQEIRGRAQPK